MLIYTMLHAVYFLFASENKIFSLILRIPEFACSGSERFDRTPDQCEYLDSETNSTLKCSVFSYKEGKQAYVTSEVRS